jgi:hypothetical protein
MENADTRLLRRPRRRGLRCGCGCDLDILWLVLTCGKPVLPPRNGVYMLALPKNRTPTDGGCARAIELARSLILVVDEPHRVVFTVPADTLVAGRRQVACCRP